MEGFGGFCRISTPRCLYSTFLVRMPLVKGPLSSHMSSAKALFTRTRSARSLANAVLVRIEPPSSIQIRTARVISPHRPDHSCHA